MKPNAYFSYLCSNLAAINISRLIYILLYVVMWLLLMKQIKIIRWYIKCTAASKDCVFNVCENRQEPRHSQVMG